jgi:hypothetical protein
MESVTSLRHAPALSIRQPWAQLILQGRKRLELRTWATTHRGLFWVHAPKVLDDHASQRFKIEGAFRGGVVGYCRLDGVFPIDANRWDMWRSEHLEGGEFPGSLFGWMVTHAVALADPVEVSGRLGFFELPIRVLDMIFARNDLVGL